MSCHVNGAEKSKKDRVGRGERRSSHKRHHEDEITIQGFSNSCDWNEWNRCWFVQPWCFCFKKYVKFVPRQWLIFFIWLTTERPKLPNDCFEYYFVADSKLSASWQLSTWIVVWIQAYLSSIQLRWRAEVTSTIVKMMGELGFILPNLASIRILQTDPIKICYCPFEH